jgi:DUF1365 family protein
MSKSDEALVALCGVSPTEKNFVVSIGREMADQYRFNSQPSPTSKLNFFVQLTPTQKQMLKEVTSR